VDGEGWHKSVGQKLTEKGKKVVEEEGAREAADGRVTLRSTAPPIDVEMSDESGDEWGRPFVESSVHGHGRKLPHIFEEEEDDVAGLQSGRHESLPTLLQSNPLSATLILYLPRLLRHRILNLDLPRMRRWRSYCDGYTIIVPAE
jgi:hypothetical protein